MKRREKEKEETRETELESERGTFSRMIEIKGTLIPYDKIQKDFKKLIKQNTINKTWMETRTTDK